MDALRKQASNLRDQVAKQQQAVIKQFSSSGYESSDVVVIGEVEMQRHHQLEKLYRATRSGKDFEKEIVKAAETFTAVGYKHIETGLGLGDILKLDLIMPLMDTLPLEQRLAPYLSEGKWSPEEILELLQSPPFCQQVDLFTYVLQTGQIDLSQFGIDRSKCE